MSRLNRDDIDRFAWFLEDRGYIRQPNNPKNVYEILRCNKKGADKDTIVVYAKSNGLVTVQKKDEKLVEEFYAVGGICMKEPKMAVPASNLSDRDISLLVEDIKYRSTGLCFEEKREMLRGISDVRVLRELCLSLL